MRMRLGPIISMMVVGLLLSLPHTGQALPFTFTKIADTNTSIPGGTGNFTLFGAPSLETGTVTFTDFGPSGQTGFYSSPIGGPLQATSPPTPGGDMASFGLDAGGQLAIFTDEKVVANTSTPVPGELGTFFSFFGSSPSLDGGNVAFLGHSSSGNLGIYTDINGFLNVVADTGSGNFLYFTGDLSIDGEHVAFIGFDVFGQQGIYTNIGGSADEGHRCQRFPGRQNCFQFELWA